MRGTTNYAFCYRNERRFDSRTRSPFLPLLLSTSTSPLPLPRFSFFCLVYTYARITSGAPLASEREDDVTTLSGRPERREVYRTISWIAAATRHCRLDLRGFYGFLFFLKKKIRFFLSLSPEHLWIYRTPRDF